MKNNKYGEVTTCCWSYRHELLGLVLLVLATILTIATASGLGIFAMFIVGLGLCCRKCLPHHCCHPDPHCHREDENCEVLLPEKIEKPVRKSRVKKAT